MLPKELLADLETGDRTMEMLKNVPAIEPSVGLQDVIFQGLNFAQASTNALGQLQSLSFPLARAAHNRLLGEFQGFGNQLVSASNNTGGLGW